MELPSAGGFRFGGAKPPGLVGPEAEVRKLLEAPLHDPKWHLDGGKSGQTRQDLSKFYCKMM